MNHRWHKNIAQLLAAVVLFSFGSIAASSDDYELPDDPLDSVMWENMAQRFFPGEVVFDQRVICLLYTSPSPRDGLLSRMPSSA